MQQTDKPERDAATFPPIQIPHRETIKTEELILPAGRKELKPFFLRFSPWGITRGSISQQEVTETVPVKDHSQGPL